MVDALLRTRVPDWRALNRAVDERDDMLHFAMQLFEHDRDRAITNYFQNGLEQHQLLEHIAAWRGRPRRMLDFASGYGRLSRLLVHQHLADDVTVSDILEGAMEFQAAQFGVRTILSKADPEEFAAPDRYDLIFVASLFTHLPPPAFVAWLRRLARLLEPAGMLIFSVHDEWIAPGKVDGIGFSAESESRVLDANEYGSTWVSEKYVREQVAGLPGEWACVRMPRALGDWQDVYVISPAPLPVEKFRRAPKGHIDSFRIGTEGVQIAGWATSVSAPADRVEVRLDDELVATIRDFAPRPDVAAGLGSGEALLCEWACLLPHESIRSFRYQVVTISAFSTDGYEHILYLGTIDSLNGNVARERAKAVERKITLIAHEMETLRHDLAVAKHERSVIAQQMSAMRRSRFWRTRDQWFALKRALRLTDEK